MNGGKAKRVPGEQKESVNVYLGHRLRSEEFIIYHVTFIESQLKEFLHGLLPYKHLRMYRFRFSELTQKPCQDSHGIF